MVTKTTGVKKVLGKDVHHRNGNPRDNRPKNLAVTSKTANRSFRRTRNAKKLQGETIMPMHGKKKSKMMNRGGAAKKKSKMMNKGGAMKKKVKMAYGGMKKSKMMARGGAAKRK